MSREYILAVLIVALVAVGAPRVPEVGRHFVSGIRRFFG
jgi:Sec-independent protein translocase protein TatA